MAYYDKKVIYLSEMEYGNRIKGAGFVKVECRGESCSFAIHVSGLRELPEKKYDINVISLHGKEYPIGKIFLHKGEGDWKAFYEKGRVALTEDGENNKNNSGASLSNGAEGLKEGIGYGEIAEIIVKISDTKTLMGKLSLEGTSFGRKTVQAAELATDVSAGADRKETVTKGGEKKGEKRGEKKEEKTGEKVEEINEGRGIWKFVRGGREQIMEEKADRQRKAAGDAEQANVRGEAESRNHMEKEDKSGKVQEHDSKRAGSMKSTEQDKDNRKTERDTEPKAEWKWGGNGRAREKNAGEVTGGERKKEPKEEQKQEQRIHVDDVILNDKWDQLKQIYSVVHPYEDERQYIAIQPKDFVIMTGDYQHLANNSFLLHGFYNYRHIILGREQDGCFYLGVPGVYYEREKMVALMFGFEAFECEGGIAEAGKFGYYLRRVKI